MCIGELISHSPPSPPTPRTSFHLKKNPDIFSAEAMANVVADDAAEMAEGAVGGAVVGGAEGGDDATQLSKIAEGKRSGFLSF